jgi:hypothetical protein
MSFIRVVQHESRSLWWWYEQAISERLDLSPDFQRRSELWSVYKRAHLIDSVLNDFDVPKLYVADFTIAKSGLNRAKRPYAVVDGKQRFEAFFAYFRGEFGLNQSTLIDANPAFNVKGLNFSQLKASYPELARKLMSFEPVVMSLTTDDDRKIYEMFVRLNSGEAASSAERRNAKPGPVPMLVRELADHPFFTNRIGFNTKRMQDFNLAAKFMLIEYRGGFVDTKAANLDRFVLDAARETTPQGLGEASKDQRNAADRYVRTRDRVINVLEGLSEAFESDDPMLKNAGRIPVYYWVVREHPEVAPNFRDFIGEFEGRALEAMRLDRDGEHLSAGMERYLTYYTLSRSANDQASLLRRYEILRSELKRRRLID